MPTVPTDVRRQYERFLSARHRPSHRRRTAASHAGFFLEQLRPGTRVLDVGCGPASITAGLGEGAIGVDLAPERAGSVPVAAADVYRLPFADGVFGAVYCCAVLQHLADPRGALAELRRVCAPGAVIGVADADWGGQLRVPDDPMLGRGQEILEALRGDANPYIGSRLRGLLHEAGFGRAAVTAKGFGGGDPTSSPAHADVQARFFEAPEAVAFAVAEGVSTAEEMDAVARAWRRWGDDPAAVSTGWWFEALAWAE